MNLFRSEECVQAWGPYDPAAHEGTMPLAHYVRWFDTPRHRERLAPDYLLRLQALTAEMGPIRQAIRDELRGAGHWEP